MPNTASAKKALRKSLKRRDHNRAGRSALRSALKKVRVAAAGEDKDATQEAFRNACKKLDQAAAKNLIHANKAARTKSRLSALVKKSTEA
ncbi:30S ribosomal protein S20 [Calycomorphotria hydatis]|uniref:Small ribosomal subunit protein bS20 n=1 Tax=Calycomorphotria hydatis TaxID=2528027 RepID=A0A517T858_9PLAN|nr:30S ribosomal protein S20 [Calycomorphotria hydatis]QDT64542.1 30S ribosomal protein S20 [Calycomorphotria hydatis]